MAWILVKKLEMTRVVKDNALVPVTLLKVPKIQVLQIKTLESDGYTAVVLGVSDTSVELKEGNKALANKEFSDVKEILVSEEEISNYTVGQEITVDALEGVAAVKLVWTSKGRGFAGAMKRHNFSWGPASHGSKFHRALGSIGNRKPTRTHKGKKMHGHMWNARVTLRSVPVEVINKDLSVIGVRGPVPGGRKSLVVLEF